MNERRLGRVRRVRELQERVLRAEWALAQRAVTEAEEAIDGILELRTAARAELEQRVSVGTLDPREVLNEEDTLDRLDGALAAAETRRRAAQRVADARRAPWQERRTDAEALRRLEGKQRAERRAAAAKAEQAQMDDLTSARGTLHRQVHEREALETEPTQYVEIDR